MCPFDSRPVKAAKSKINNQKLRYERQDSAASLFMGGYYENSDEETRKRRAIILVIAADERWLGEGALTGHMMIVGSDSIYELASYIVTNVFGMNKSKTYETNTHPLNRYECGSPHPASNGHYSSQDSRSPLLMNFRFFCYSKYLVAVQRDNTVIPT